jgi:hypothetical protein
MNKIALAARKSLGAVVLVVGVVALAFIAFVVATGGITVLASTGVLALVFLFSLALLLTCSGATLLFLRAEAATGSLAPRWALKVSGAALLASVAGLAYFGGARSAGGMVLLGGLGAYWLWSGFKQAG